MIEEEGVRNVILGVALEVEDDPELVVNEASSCQLLELVTDLLPELWESDCGYKDPGARSCASLYQLHWVFLSTTRELLVWIVELLPQGILDEVQLTYRCLDV